MWKVTFNQDTDIDGEGTITATNENFSFSKRINTKNTEEVDAFITEVTEKFADKEAIKTKIDSIITSIEDKLNK